MPFRKRKDMSVLWKMAYGVGGGVGVGVCG